MTGRLIFPATFAVALLATAAALARETVPLDDGWRFHLGEIAAASGPAFDDSGWRPLAVPHDWAFEAPFAADAAQGAPGGYKPGGIGWYRREIEVPAAWSSRRLRLEFDGVYMDSEVWLNGASLGRRAYGYLSFGYDLTPHLHPGRNVLAVRVDNSREPSARWYHGCGIYAPVRLVVTDPVGVAPDGVQITMPHVATDSAEVRVVTTLATPPPAGTRLTTRLLAPDGREVAAATTGLAAAEGDTTQTLTVPAPRLWSPDSPQLYTAVSEVRVGDRLADTVRTRFGVRSLRWDAATGFWLNGQNLKLRGVADHLEAGPTGAAVPEKLLRWKLARLRAMGVNAIRTAHNPQVPQFYDLCDELGLLVLDEIFDGWSPKAAEDYGARFFATNWERDLRAWLRRDRNHPCVIAWDVGNETRGPVAADLVRVCHELDPTRPVTSGDSAPAQMDLLGVNGRSEKQSFFRERPPAKPLVATEAPHTWQVRGFYRTRTWWRDGYPNPEQDPFPLPDLTATEIFTCDWAPAAAKTSAKQVFNSSYDNATVRISARKNWELVRDLPWHSGHFRWTGFDYLGEANYVHGGWPFRAFMGGALDLAGFEKDLFYLYQSQWTTAPMVHLLPHWTHPRLAPGTPVPVWAYTNADEVELFLNGRSLGSVRPGRKADEMQGAWLVPWEPGTLEAVARAGGREVARTRHVTAGAPARLQVTTDTTALAADGRDVAIITVAQTDAAGNFYPYGENRVAFRLDGPARLLSLENGNPVDTEPNFGVTTRRTFFGLARAFIQSTRAAGDIALTVGAISGERRQLTSNLVSIDVRRVALRGTAPDAAFAITYTTDGTAPTAASARYTAPFAVPLGSTVRALVRIGDRDSLRLEESFAADAGLHWLSAGESATTDDAGLQAETARLAGGATTRAALAGHRGSGYALVPVGGTVEWYQENDGALAPFALHVRAHADAPARFALAVNDRALPPQAVAPAGDGWQTFTFAARLQSGGNTLRLTVLDGGPLAVDELAVTAAP